MSLASFSQDVIDFVQQHEVWAAPIVFGLAFGESLAFISLLLPAWTALLAMGALIGAGKLAFTPILIAGALGAAFGDWLSYWFGFKFKDSVRHMWPLSRHPEFISKGEAFITEYGAAAIFIGRFFGPLRASVPLVAGILAMPYGRFQLANFASAFVWAGVLLTLGDVTSTVIKWIWEFMQWV
jgi:membrane protein DedA with SNARE-associated domain